MRYKKLSFGALSVVLLSAVGCGGGGSSSPAAASLAVNPTGKITAFTTVETIKAGTVFNIVLDRPSGRVLAPVKLTGTSNDANGRKIYFTIANHPVGSGDAGALIVDSKGNSVGALDAGFGAADGIFEATAIEDEQSILLSGPVAKTGPKGAAAATSDGLSRLVRGVSPYLWSIMSKDPRNSISKIFTLDTSTPPKIGPAPEIAKGSLYGTTIFMVSSYGDAVSAYTTGSITAPYLGKLLCYGHSLNWEGGSQQIPCYFGTVNDFIVDPSVGDSKLAFPNLSRPAGTLIDDRRFGVVVDPTVTATPIPIIGTVTLNTNAAVTFKGYVAQDNLNATTFALLNIAQGVSNVVDASDIAGSSTGSATIDFADGTSQTLDLTDSSVSPLLLSDLYFNFANVLYDPSTGDPIPLMDITFSYTITSSAPSVRKGHSAIR